MVIEQFVMAYGVEQDRVRAMMPDGYESLRPVLRINAEIMDEKNVYVELNAPVAHDGKRGWLNIAKWHSAKDNLKFQRDGKRVRIKSPFLTIDFTGTGIEGGCPAERDNDGCFFIDENETFRPSEVITANKEFCDCEFAWFFHSDDAHGRSEGKTIPAFQEEAKTEYPRCTLTAENAAAIPCKQVLGAYSVTFERIQVRNNQ